MAPILTIFGPNESQRCQLNFEKNLGSRKNFREGEKFEKLSRKVLKILARTRFLGRNKIETFKSQAHLVHAHLELSKERTVTVVVSLGVQRREEWLTKMGASLAQCRWVHEIL